jgi:ankyrin repeat protein
VSAKSFAPSKLISAIRAGRLSGVIAALDDGSDLEEADIHGCTGLPLRTACFAGDMAIVRELLRCGADVNALAADGPGAPLRLALRAGHQAIAALLVQHGAAIPPGISLTADVTNRVGTLAPVGQEVTVPILPDTPDTASDVEFEFEATAPFPGHLIEEVDVNACYGTDTNLLTIDLLRHAAAEANAGGQSPQPDRTPAAKAGFWKTKQTKE